MTRRSAYQASSVITLLFLALVASSSLPPGPQPLSTAINTEFPEEAIEYHYIYPNASLSEVRNASQLAERVFSGLGEALARQQDIDPTAFYGPVQLIFRSPPFEDPFDGFVQGYQVIGFLSGNGSLLRMYYGNAPNNNGYFLALLANFTASDILARDSSEYEYVARGTAGRLGIPVENLSYVDYIYGSNFDYSFGKNTTTVILSTKVFGYPLTGCNLVAATFDNYSKRLVAIQARPYVTVPAILNVSSEIVLTVGKNAALLQKEKPGDRFKSDRIAGIRFVPVAVALNPQPVPGDPNNLTYSVSLNIRYGFEYIADFVDSRYDPATYSVLVAVDVESGAVLFTFLSGIPIVVDHELVLAPWLVGTIVIAVAVPLIVAGAIAVSPESALVIVQFLIVPLYMRLRGSEVLDSFNRGRIYGHISAQPGCSFSDLKSALGVGNGTLAYHLMVLERLELVKSTKGGKLRRYYPQGVSASIRKDQYLGKTEAMVLNELISKGPMSISSLAAALGVSRQRVHYNARLLLKRGLVKCEDFVWQAESVPSDEEAF